MNMWTVGAIIAGLLLIAGFVFAGTFVTADSDSPAEKQFECSSCGNSCTAESNCGLQSCGAVSGSGSCGCGNRP